MIRARAFSTTAVRPLLRQPWWSGSLLLAAIALVPHDARADELFFNGDGMLGVHRAGGGPVHAPDNAFFQRLGTNGRSCATCHVAADGMSIQVGTIRRLFDGSRGTDPLFAPVDAANCPNEMPPPGASLSRLRAAYSLLLNKGLIRVALPLPKATRDLSPFGGEPSHPTEYTLSVVLDAAGCNTDPAYSRKVDPVTQEITQIVSVYRRPRMAANLPAIIAPAFTLGPQAQLPNIDFVTGAPVLDPVTGLPVGGNLMWDGREPTLESQAIAATLGHAQALQPPTPAQVAEIVAFERSVFAAQARSFLAGDLTGADGSTAHGGPAAAAALASAAAPFALYDGWFAPPSSSGSWKDRQRAAIGRGQALFNTRSFPVGNVAGLNNAALLGVPNPVPLTCASCHGNLPSGTDPFPAAQRSIGTGGQAVLRGGGPPPSPDLPIFKLSCRAPYTTPYDGATVFTNDPGMALITGRCADIGRKTPPQIRALAARPPYFSDGSAATVRDVVRFYDLRFSMRLSEAEIQDLTAFLLAL